MHPCQAREEVDVVAPEMAVDRPVRLKAEELAHDLGGQHVAVGQHGRRAPLAHRLLAEEVIRHAEHPRRIPP